MYPHIQLFLLFLLRKWIATPKWGKKSIVKNINGNVTARFRKGQETESLKERVGPHFTETHRSWKVTDSIIPNLSGVALKVILFSRKGRTETVEVAVGHTQQTLQKNGLSVAGQWPRRQRDAAHMIIKPTLENVIFLYLRTMTMHLYFKYFLIGLTRKIWPMAEKSYLS